MRTFFFVFFSLYCHTTRHTVHDKSTKSLRVNTGFTTAVWHHLLWPHWTLLVRLVGLILRLVAEEVAGQDGGGVGDLQDGCDARSAAPSAVLCRQGEFAAFLRGIWVLEINGYSAWKQRDVILSYTTTERETRRAFTVETAHTALFNRHVLISLQWIIAHL